MIENKRPKYGRGSLVVYNPTKEFGNKEDKLLHIHSTRIESNKKDSKKEFLYNGRLFKTKKYDSFGISYIPSYLVSVADIPESQLKGLEHLVIKNNFFI